MSKDKKSILKIILGLGIGILIGWFGVGALL